MTTGRLFAGQRLTAATDRARAAIDAEIARLEDDTVLEIDADRFAEEVAAAEKLTAPSVDVEAIKVVRGGRVKVDCTGAAGISYSINDYGNFIRDGYAFEVKIPGSGNLPLIRTAVLGAPQLPGEICSGEVVCAWEWPEPLGAPAFAERVGEFKNELRRGIEVLATEVENANSGFRTYAIKQIEERRSAVLAERDFLGALALPIVREEDPPEIAAPPLIRRRESAAAQVDSPEPERTDRELGPQLDESYDHILEVIRLAGRGLERSPGSFAQASEETLRDHLLTTLNTHYKGAAHAEAFNGSGRTDILIRVHNRNVFIGECKWWTGAKALEDALEQLFGYTTWKDSRVALVFFVPTNDMTATIDKARAALGTRGEFVEWLAGEREGELRCRVRWPEDSERRATLTAVFIHLSRT